MLIGIQKFIKSDNSEIKNIWIVFNKETAGPTPAVSYVSVPKDSTQFEIEDEQLESAKTINLKVWFVKDGANSIKFYPIKSLPLDVSKPIGTEISHKTSEQTENTDEKRNELLVEVDKKIEQSKIFTSNPIGTKNLLYYVIYTNEQYIEMLEMSIASLYKFNNREKFDILIITDTATKKILETKIDGALYHITESPKNMVHGSMNKTKIFDYKSINDYQNILFLDCDTIINADISEIFNTDSDKFHTAYLTDNDVCHLFRSPTQGFTILTDNDVEWFRSRNQQPFNAGQFLFKNSPRMQHHFKNLNWFIDNWTGEHFFEQSFMNYYFCRAELADRNHLKSWVEFLIPEEGNTPRNLPIVHFAGSPLKGWVKLNFIRKCYRDIIIYKKPKPILKEYIKYPFQKIAAKLLPKKETTTESSNKSTNLVKHNTKSSYPDTIVGKNVVLKKLSKLKDKALSKSSTPIGSKNLVYYTIDGSFEWVELLDMSLKSLAKQFNRDFDVLLITSEEMRHTLSQLESANDLNVHYMIVKRPIDGVEASLNKIKIHKWKDISNYNKVLFLDCDTVVLGDISEIFNMSLGGDKFYTAWRSEFIENTGGYRSFTLPFHGIGMLDKDDIERLKKYDQRPFNAGQFLFVASPQMLEHFKNIDWLASEWPGEYFFEQAFMSHYFCDYMLTDGTKLDPLVDIHSIVNKDPKITAQNRKDAVVFHFVGKSLNAQAKLDYIKSFFYHANIH